MVGIFQKQKGKAQETEHTQSPLIKTPSHATLNGSKQVRQVESSGMIKQTSSSKKQSMHQLLTGEIKEGRKEPKQSKHKNKLKFNKTQSTTRQTNNA